MADCYVAAASAPLVAARSTANPATPTVSAARPLIAVGALSSPLVATISAAA